VTIRQSADEADTCRKSVVPLLQQAGWDNDPHSIAEQRTVTDGRIIPVGKGFVCKPPKRVDDLLRYTRDFPLAGDEAKASYKTAADAVQQARAYAEMLGLKFAFSTKGNDIIEIDYFIRLISAAKIVPNRFHQNRTVSCATSMPRSCSRSSTLRSESR
jgi:type I restriction enzyme, R subunit